MEKCNIKPASWTNNIQEYFFSLKIKELDLMKKQGLNIINLGIGSPDMLPPTSVIKTMQESANLPNANKYQSYIGIKSLRKAFSLWYLNNYNVILNPDNEILPLMGSKEGIMYISMTYLKKGDEVLIPDPGYPVYNAVTKMLNAKPIFYELKEENQWIPDINYLDQLNTKNIKILWINYPHMPTGANIDLFQLDKLVSFARSKNILLIHDNPYSLLVKKKPISIFNIKEAKTIALELNSLSKSHNMSGWRIGMVAGNKYFIKNIIKTKSQIDTGMYLPLQIGAIEALKYSKKWIQYLNKKYEIRRKIIYKICKKLKLSYNIQNTGIFVWAKINNNNIDDINWSNNILYKYHIFITPGSIFGKCGAGYVRLSLCSSTKELKEAKSRI